MTNDIYKNIVPTRIKCTFSNHYDKLYLGVWCNKYSTSSESTRNRQRTVSYHWNDLKKFSKDYCYLSDLHEGLLLAVAKKLNEIHNLNHETKYWRIVIGPWLGIFTQILFDRWETISLALRDHKIYSFATLPENNGAWTPSCMEEFVLNMTRDEWNFYIFSEIMRHKNKDICENQFYKHPSYVAMHRIVSENINFKKYIKRFISNCLSLISSHSDIFLYETHLSFLENILLHLRLHQFPQYWDVILPQKFHYDPISRDWSIHYDANNDFEEFLKKMISKHLPIAYLEGFNFIRKQIDHLAWPAKPKAIYSSNALFHNTMCMIYTAEKSAFGSKILYGQHGGNYWMLKFHWGEKHEIAIADKFLSWGYSTLKYKHVVSLFYLGKIFSNTSNTTKSKITIILQSPPRYSYSLHSSPKSEHVIDKYLDNSFIFVESLSKSVQKKLFVRLSSHNYGWDLHERWLYKFENIEIDAGHEEMQYIFDKTEIFVVTYCATTFFEAIYINKPVIGFWDIMIDPFDDFASAMYEKLNNVGVFHYDPVSAAIHIENHISDIDSWWNSELVQQTLHDFRNSYCRSSQNRICELAKFIHNQANELTR